MNRAARRRQRGRSVPFAALAADFGFGRLTLLLASQGILGLPPDPGPQGGFYRQFAYRAGEVMRSRLTRDSFFSLRAVSDQVRRQWPELRADDYPPEVLDAVVYAAALIGKVGPGGYALIEAVAIRHIEKPMTEITREAFRAAQADAGMLSMAEVRDYLVRFLAVVAVRHAQLLRMLADDPARSGSEARGGVLH